MSTVRGVNPGRLNRKLSIYRYINTQSGMNSRQSKLVKVRTVWAEMKPTRGTEFLEYYKDANALQYKVTMRYIPDLTEKDVLVHNGRQYEINSVINVEEAGIVLEVYCTEAKDRSIPYATEEEIAAAGDQ